MKVFFSSSDHCGQKCFIFAAALKKMICLFVVVVVVFCVVVLQSA